MKINESHFYQSILQLKERVVASFTPQQKKIIAIASLAFACLAAILICTKRKKITFPQGTRFEGQLEKDNLSGKGKIIYPTGKIEEGQFRNGELTSQGVIIYPNGVKKEGVFKNSELHGQGKVLYPDGTILTGQFKNGELVSQGKLTYFDGSTNEGQFKNEKVTNIIEPKGGRWEGEFSRSFLYPSYYPDPHDPQGPFQEVLPEIFITGKGKYTAANGTVYDGEFQNNHLIGQGTITYPNGNITEGVFDSINSFFGKMTEPNVRTVEGSFLNGYPRGRVKVTEVNGAIKEGMFDPIENPQYDLWGYGKLTDPNTQIIYEGTFKQNRLDGRGKIILPDGTKHEGVFIDGVLQ